MDKTEAAQVLRLHLQRYRALSHGELQRRIGEIDAFSVEGPSGTEYQIEIEVFWDARPGGDLRVLGSIDDGGFRSSLSPVCEDFILAPDGTFVGE